MDQKKDSYFHLSLGRLSQETDPVIHYLQKEKRTRDANGNWLLYLCLQPLKDIPNLTRVIKGLKNINLAAIPIAGTVTTIVCANLFTSWELAWQILLTIMVAIILYLITLPFYLQKMLTFYDKSFHYQAYIKFRAQEFHIVSYAVENNMSLKSLYDFITGVLTKQDENSKLVEMIIAKFEKEKEELKTEWDNDKAILVDTMNEMNEEIESLVNEISNNEDLIRYYSELLKDVNILLYRYYNGLLGFSDLKFMSGITLYKAEGDVLKKIADEGTTGKTKSIIKIDDERYKHWAAIHAFKAEDNKPRANEPRKGYFVVSYKILMSGESGEKTTWLLNFHVDSVVNVKAWNLLLNDDILDTSETYRLFHGICLLLLKNLDEKGLDQHVGN
ncbi:hypothetical protein CIL05_16805 [Virgibacillus profundi]|uniref:Uncharacterized protein n=1 Tax=Virgibacillus profundi TaxID=2024555 RepID=A0A2A2IAE0_9BACI|nr:hypothetical protein [Virgibacillus profundi]PAV28296.1 hypothetical protein CIL05_16805 [Virgibacillus profundi]PXY54915.1 hypothetical protein CIT14_03180 [Virgibacillus profundi]